MKNTVRIEIEASAQMYPVDRIWCSFGYDELNWTYTPKGKEIFRQIGNLTDGPYWIRNHNAFTSGNKLSWDCWGSTNCYTEDENNRPKYDWSENDRIFDVFLENGCKPMIELDFMPHDLSSHPELGPKDSWRYPPKDYERWRELNFKFARHLIDRYGKLEVRQWYFSAWNEPDDKYFRIYPGTSTSMESSSEKKKRCSEFCKLYDYTASGILAADDGLRFGGPDLAYDLEFFNQFLSHCHSGINHTTKETGSRLDFISVHSKATGKVGGKVPNPDFDKIARRSFLKYFSIIKKFPGFETVPILGNEWDIDVGTSYGLHDSPDFGFRNNSYYPVFVIRAVKEILDLKHGQGINVELITQWAFYFEGKRCFEGTRSIFDPMGIRKAVFNGFEMLSRLGDTRIIASSGDTDSDIAPGEAAGKEGTSAYQARRPKDDTTVDNHPGWDSIKPRKQVDALATRTETEIQILIWNQVYDQYAEGQKEIALRVRGLGGWERARLTHYRIDREHSNAQHVWQGIGCPDWPTEAQLEAIREREGLEKYGVDAEREVTEGRIELCFALPMHAVSLLLIKKTQTEGNERQ